MNYEWNGCRVRVCLSESDLWYSIDDSDPVVPTIPAPERDERELVEVQIDSMRCHIMYEVIRDGFSQLLRCEASEPAFYC